MTETSPNTLISNLNEENGIMTFTLFNVNVSIANSLRRIILSEIPTIIIHSFPYDENMVDILLNTTRFNNEIIKQRLSCIPIHITDLSIPLEDYIIELNQTNNSNITKYVTTQHFKIKNIKQDRYLSPHETNEIFPPNSLTKQYIDILRLKPKIDDSSIAEQISLTAKLSINHAKNNGSYNVVSTCFYQNTPDFEKREIEANKFLSENQTSDDTEESIANKKINWELLDGKRIFIDDSFDFTIKSIGVFPNKEIFIAACNIMQEKLSFLIDKCDKQELVIETNKTTMNNAFDIKLENEDYTLGKVVEFILYDKYFIKEDILNYCGFKKFHPHDTYSIIRLAFKEPIDKELIGTYITAACKIGIETYELIKLSVGH